MHIANRKPSTLVAIGVALVATTATVITAVEVSHSAHNAGATQCSPLAVRQLPKMVVDTVNANQRQYKIAALPNATTLARRATTDGSVAEAFSTFDPRYCGYIGNINEFPRKAAAPSYGKPHGDKVITLRHGKQYNDSTNVCIGDTPPVAHRGVTGIRMVFFCDRLYASDTWTQGNPLLNEVTR